MSFAPDTFAAVDAIAGDYQRHGGQPGMAYGVVAGGRLVHAGGVGERSLGGPAPDAGTVFRIASMTKSFTAAAVLALRDEGSLALDDPAEDYVPELRSLPPATRDSGPVTLRRLLTMTAGFPTDDPWGDQQQGLPLPEFAALLGAGRLRYAWAPGTRWEYSNLGYAILGRVISAVSAMAYPDFIRDRLLAPLGMTRTGFEAAEFPGQHLAGGYARTGGRWSALEPDACGAFAPMGGVFSCVADLARWVAGFTAAFPPGEADAGGPHPLSRASRREMQLPQAALDPADAGRLPGGPAPTGSVGYGFGLFIEQDAAWGRIVQHSGGYPGFGSHMRWHAATGVGVIALGNGTYAGAGTLASLLLNVALRAIPGAGPAGQPPLAPAGPWPETLAAQRAVSRLLRAWDDTAAARLFSENVAQDEPYAARRDKAAQVRERIGVFRDHPDRLAEHDTPAHCRWWLLGEHGVAQVEILLTPENPPRVQKVDLAVPPAPGSPLSRALDFCLQLLNGGACDWPTAVPVSRTVDCPLTLRRFRMAAAWAGQCQLGAYRAGDGETSVTAELGGEHGRLILALAVDPANGELHHVDISLGSDPPAASSACAALSPRQRGTAPHRLQVPSHLVRQARGLFTRSGRRIGRKRAPK